MIGLDAVVEDWHHHSFTRVALLPRRRQVHVQSVFGAAVLKIKLKKTSLTNILRVGWFIIPDEIFTSAFSAAIPWICRFSSRPRRTQLFMMANLPANVNPIRFSVVRRETSDKRETFRTRYFCFLFNFFFIQGLKSYLQGTERAELFCRVSEELKNSLESNKSRARIIGFYM